VEHVPPDDALLTTRSRELGITFGTLEPGAYNSITDVAGIEVGHSTIVDDRDGIYSGVTAIVPRALAEQCSLAAGMFIANGYGKFVGSTQILELGDLETPVLLTSTLSTFRVADAMLTWILRRAETPPPSVNPVVGEINDSWLSGAGRRPILPEHVWEALDRAASGPVAMGNVGGGTGACALGFKAGIGSSSRVVPVSSGDVTVGVLVQANMDGVLRVGTRTVSPRELGLDRSGPSTSHGSCVVVVAVDRDVPAHQLRRIAARAVFALGRTGADFGHGSGDYGLAFASTRADPCEELAAPDLDLVFRATMDAVEEAVVDSLLAADTIQTPDGRRAHALPVGALTGPTPT
jgi:D-aminopeptidase